jgi:tRNA pseudouridine55 synthase
LTHTGRVPAEPVIPEGEQMQAPPAYSAVKVGGRRLYELAREGTPREGEARPVTVYRAELVEHRDELATFDLEVSSGTYVRQLVAALGDAYCQELRRTAVGPFRLEDADPARMLSPAEALAFLPSRDLDASEAERVGHGVRLAAGPGEAGSGPLALVHRDELVAVAEPRGRELAPVVVFRA